MLLLTAVQGRAQTTTADVVGTVTDSNGAVLPNAKVMVENLATHGTHTTQTTTAAKARILAKARAAARRTVPRSHSSWKSLQ